jgi:hypothetical protein
MQFLGRRKATGGVTVAHGRIFKYEDMKKLSWNDWFG